MFVVWFVAIYLFSNQTGSESSRLSDKVTRKLLQVKDVLSVVMEHYEQTNEIVIKGIETNPITNERVDKWELSVRKLAHYFLFALGGVLIYWILECFNIPYKVLLAIFLGMLLACADEFHQMYSLNRGPGVFDVVIDTLGIISGVLFGVLSAKIITKIDYKLKKGKKVYDKFQKNNRRKNCKSS